MPETLITIGGFLGTIGAAGIAYLIMTQMISLNSRPEDQRQLTIVGVVSIAAFLLGVAISLIGVSNQTDAEQNAASPAATIAH